jgi:hypothetical protein
MVYVVRGAFRVQRIGGNEARLAVNAIRNSAILQFPLDAPRITFTGAA